MTKEKILAMEPGPELDTLVAEKVMGHPMPDFIPEDALDLYLVGTPIYCDSWSCVCRYDEGDTPKWVPDPYSTDISAAWPVVGKMESLGYGHKHLKYSQRREAGIAWMFMQPGRGIFEARGKKAPEAICKAALIIFVGK